MADCYIVGGKAVKKKLKVKYLLKRIKALEERVAALEAKQWWPYGGTWWIGEPTCQPPHDTTITITCADQTNASAE
ncbi:MAG: hypothetical protein ABFD92_21305 [Planctomycetaceae bacterium]